jgi:GNAT superfamily N-acetyltransferase
MSEFAEFAPHARHPFASRGGIELAVRRAIASDLSQAARIIAAREDRDPEIELQKLERELVDDRDPPRSVLWVATLRERVIGFARAGYFSHPPDAPPEAAPEGWYLFGVVVDPDHRRLGAGSALTRARLDWIAERSHAVYYFASALNRVTIVLHERFGFRELTREFWFPAVSFRGGVGALFVLELETRRAEGY